MIWLCPESPRWLVSKRHFEETRNILIKYYGNGEENEMDKDEFQEILASVEADNSQLRVNEDGVKTIFGSRGNLYRLWTCFVTVVASQCGGSVLIS